MADRRRYTHDLFRDVLEGAGFHVSLLEWCDDAGVFNARDWDASDGPIYRSLRTDHRNRGGTLGIVSLIADAHKPIAGTGARLTSTSG